MNEPKPPSHLSVERRALWGEIVGEWDLMPHHLALLAAAMECLDRATQARKLVEKEGVLIAGRFGSRAHPGCAIEAQAKVTASRLLREIGLDVEARSDSRPPRLGGR